MISLIKRSLIYILSGLISQAAVLIVWIFLPIFISAEEIGQLSIILFVVDLLSIVAVFGMDSAIIRFGVMEENKGNSYRNGMRISFMALIIISIIYFFIVQQSYFEIKGVYILAKEFFLLIIFSVLANTIWTNFQAYQTVSKEATKYALFQIARSILFISLSFILLSVTNNGFSMLLGSGVSTFIVFFIFRFKSDLKGFKSNNYCKNDCKLLLAYSIPLVINSILGVASNYAQRLVLDQYTTGFTLGVYSYFAVIVLQITGFWAAFNRAWTPEYYELNKINEERALQILQNIMINICFYFPLLIIAIIVAFEAGLKYFLLKEEFLVNVNTFYLLLLAPMFTGMYMAGFPLYYQELKTRMILFISILSVALNIIITIMLVSNYGAIGASIAFVLQSVLNAYLYLSWFRNWYKGAPRVLLQVFITTLMAIISMACVIIKSELIYYVGILAASSMIAWFMNMSDIKKSFSVLKKLRLS